MDRSILKHGSPLVRVGQRWQSNDRRDRGLLVPARVLEVTSVVRGPGVPRAYARVVTGRPKAIGQIRKVRLSAFLGGSRGFTLVADVPTATPSEIVTETVRQIEALPPAPELVTA